MRVLLMSQYDAAGQNYLLAQAMRKLLDWDAKSMILQQTYLDYPTDWTMENKEEATEFAKTADVFIVQEMLFDVPGMHLKKLYHQKNTIIYGLGSIMRAAKEDVINYVRGGWHVLPPISDPTITRFIGGAPFEAIIVDPRVEELTKDIKKNDKLTICMAPTKEMKGQSRIEKILEGIEAKWLLIERMPWEEAIKEKAKAHITIDSLGDSSYGVTSLEGMALGHICISNIAPWCYALHLELPVLTTWGKTDQEIKELISCVVENPGISGTHLSDKDAEMYWRREEGKTWVKRHFSPERICAKWEKYIDWCISS